jgi:hypothetical protein
MTSSGFGMSDHKGALLKKFQGNGWALTYSPASQNELSAIIGDGVSAAKEESQAPAPQFPTVRYEPDWADIVLDRSLDWRADGSVPLWLAGARADCEEIDILHGRSGCLHTVQNRAATCFHGAAQIALIQLIRAFSAIEGAFQIKMAMTNIAIQEDLADALALLARRMKALLLGEPNQRIRRSDTEDPRMVHWSPANSCEASVSPS